MIHTCIYRGGGFIESSAWCMEDSWTWMAMAKDVMNAIEMTTTTTKRVCENAYN